MNSSTPSRQATLPEPDFLTYVIHLLSQPMTALQCSLELALEGQRTSQEYRTSIESALENSERLRQRLLLVRELAEAGEPVDKSSAVPLASLLAEAVEEVRPLFESAGMLMRVECGPVAVVGNRLSLLRACLYVLEYLLRTHAAPDGTTAIISANLEAESIAVTFHGFGRASHPNEANETTEFSPQLEIARRTFEAAGGSFAFPLKAVTDEICRIRLASASAMPAKQVVSAPRKKPAAWHPPLARTLGS